MKRTLEEYLNIPYKYEIIPSPEGGYVITVPDLPGCITQAETYQEALSMIEDAKKAWIESALEDGIEIPEPISENNYSGKFNIRVPKSLHRALAQKAKEEDVSLNQLVIYHLSKGIGHKGL